MANNLVTLLFDGASRRKQFWTKGRAVAAVSIMAQLVAVLVTKRPSLAPLQVALTTLLAPTEDQAATENAVDVEPILQRIRELRGRMIAATLPEQEKLKLQVEALVDLVTDRS
jgi:anti-sigma-K factor RskA